MIIGLIPGLLAAGCARSVNGQAVAASAPTAAGRTTTPDPTISARPDPTPGSGTPSASGSPTPTAGTAVDLDEFLDRLQAANEQVTSTVGTFDLQGPDRSSTTFTVTQKDGIAQDWELGLTLPDDPAVDESESGVADLEVTVRLVDGQTYLAGEGVLAPLGVGTPWVTPEPGTGSGAVAELADTFGSLRHGLGPEFIDQLTFALDSVELVDNGQLTGLGDTPVDVWHYQGEADPRGLIDADPAAGPVTMDLFLDARDRVVHAAFSQPTDAGEIVGTISISAFDTVPSIEAPAPADVSAR